MAFKISFRRLAEVRVLHGFYLENGVKDSFFKLSEAEKTQRLIKSGYDIRRDIDIKPTDECALFLKNHKIVFLPTVMGFTLAIEVDEVTGKLKPKARFPNEWRLAFEVNIKNPNWVTFTNTKIKTASSPLRLYWTNTVDNTQNAKLSLSAPLADFDASQAYEMGEWVVKDKQNKQAQLNNNEWFAVRPYLDYTTEADRRALPRQCKFSPFVPLTTKVEVLLTKINDKNTPPFEAKWVIKSDSDTPLSIIGLDLRVNPKDKNLIDKGLYNLAIRCEDKKGVGLTKVYNNIVLTDGIKSSSFGLIELVQKGNVRLLDTEGAVITDKDILKGGRVFEIRLQNRITYWQYIERKEGVLNKDAEHTNKKVLGDTLLTVEPYPLTNAHLPIDFTETNQLPSPTRLSIREKDSRYITDIMY